MGTGVVDMNLSTKEVLIVRENIQGPYLKFSVEVEVLKVLRIH